MGLESAGGDRGTKEDLPMPNTSKRVTITRHGIISQQDPGFSFPKDTMQSMLAQIERRGKATPGPVDHYAEPSWESIGGRFGAGASAKGRQTFFDEAMNRSRKVPSPTRYDNEQEHFSVLGKME